MHMPLVHIVPPMVHGSPSISWLSRHVPLALHVSGSVHSVSDASPQPVPTGSWLLKHVPEALQVSGLVQSVLDESPQVVPADSWLS